MALNNSRTLVSLVTEFREGAAAGESQRSLIGWLSSLMKDLDVRMYTDICTVPPLKECHDKRGLRQVPVVIRRGILRIQLDEPQNSDGVGRIILSCGRRGGLGGLRGECNGAVIDARTWTHLVVPPRAFTRRPSAKEVDRAFATPDADGIIRTGDYEIIQVSDGTVVTLYCWTHPERRPVWCLTSTNGYDVSRLNWMGDETYAEVLYGLLAEYPPFRRRPALESATASSVRTTSVSTSSTSTAGDATRLDFAIPIVTQ